MAVLVTDLASGFCSSVIGDERPAGELGARSQLYYPYHRFLLKADCLVTFAIIATSVCSPSNCLVLFWYFLAKFIQLNPEDSSAEKDLGVLVD